MSSLLIRLVINAVALLAAAYIVPGIEVTQNVGSLVLVALIFGIVNALIRPIIQFFTCPIYILTLGLFAFVVNALLLLLVDALADQFVGEGALTITGTGFDRFVTALMGSVIITIVSTILSVFLKDNGD